MNTCCELCALCGGSNIAALFGMKHHQNQRLDVTVEFWPPSSQHGLSSPLASSGKAVVGTPHQAAGWPPCWQPWQGFRILTDGFKLRPLSVLYKKGLLGESKQGKTRMPYFESSASHNPGSHSTTVIPIFGKKCSEWQIEKSSSWNTEMQFWECSWKIKKTM